MNKTEVNRFNCCPDQLTPGQLGIYFAGLVESHSWSTVKIDRNGLQFFWRHVLKKDWEWIKIIKPPKTNAKRQITSSPEARPSSPSVMLKAFEKDTITNAAKGI